MHLHLPSHTHAHPPTPSLLVFHAFQLCPREHAVSICSCTLGDDPKNMFYVVGTAFVDPTEKEPTKGRILMFQVLESACESWQATLLLHTHTHIHTYTRTHTRTRTRTHTHTHTTCTHTHIRTHAHTHIHTYIHTHTQPRVSIWYTNRCRMAVSTKSLPSVAS